jgi:hypothetical protein
MGREGAGKEEKVEEELVRLEIVEEIEVAEVELEQDAPDARTVGTGEGKEVGLGRTATKMLSRSPLAGRQKTAHKLWEAREDEVRRDSRCNLA